MNRRPACISNIDRASGTADAQAVSDLILGLADVFIRDPAGASAFLATLTAEATFNRFNSPEFDYWVSRSLSKEIVGIIGVRSKTHLYHLFVGRSHQGKGIARSLWEHANCELGNSIRTVNASSNAIRFYEQLGFTADAPEVCTAGLAFVPMSIKQHTNDSP